MAHAAALIKILPMHDDGAVSQYTTLARTSTSLKTANLPLITHQYSLTFNSEGRARHTPSYPPPPQWWMWHWVHTYILGGGGVVVYQYSGCHDGGSVGTRWGVYACFSLIQHAIPPDLEGWIIEKLKGDGFPWQYCIAFFPFFFLSSLTSFQAPW